MRRYDPHEIETRCQHECALTRVHTNAVSNPFLEPNRRRHWSTPLTRGSRRGRTPLSGIHPPAWEDHLRKSRRSRELTLVFGMITVFGGHSSPLGASDSRQAFFSPRASERESQPIRSDKKEHQRQNAEKLRDKSRLKSIRNCFDKLTLAAMWTAEASGSSLNSSKRIEPGTKLSSVTARSHRAQVKQMLG
ncbi:hypothetical protein B0H11DRAFT_2113431 [Mycena galericulata]|nr:hypothetical protein B0H11DRAFT_2113431 [Mycena galericulata]